MTEGSNRRELPELVGTVEHGFGGGSPTAIEHAAIALTELSERLEVAERERDGAREEKQIARDSAAANAELLRAAEQRLERLEEALETIMDIGETRDVEIARAALAKETAQ